MNYRSILFSLWFVVCALASGAELRAQPPEKWTEIRSENFRFAGNAAPAEIAQAAQKLEQFRFVFTKIFKQYNFTAPIPTTVLVFKDEQTFLKFKPLDVNGQPKEFVKGYFLAGTDLNYIALSADAMRANDFTTVYHEYVHFLINNTLGKTNIPPWLNEGFAEYYEQFRVENNRRITLGAANQAHLALLRKNGLMPLDKFFAVDYYTLNRQPKENMVQFYAQAWALIHFFKHSSNGAQKNNLDEFAALLTASVPAKKAFQEAFETSGETLEKELKKYVERKSLDTEIFELESVAALANLTKSLEISAADALSFQGDLLLHANRFDEAEKYLAQAVALDGESVFANTAMGFLKIKTKETVAARKFLEKATRADSTNFMAHFGYAYLLSREGMSDYGFIISYLPATADKIRASLRKAIELNPHYAESFHLYAFVNFVQSQNLDEGLEMIEKALAIAPGNQWYQIRKAELLMKKHDFSAARPIAQKVIQTAADDDLKLYSINTLNLINSWEAQLEAAKDAEKERENPAATDKILSEEEILRLNEIALRESLNQALRRPRPDEKRILGFVTGADCDSNEIVFSFNSEGRQFRLRSNSFADVILISFAPNRAGTQIGCNTRGSAQFAVITYRPARAKSANFLGEAVAIEFVPENFRLLEKIENPKD